MNPLHGQSQTALGVIIAKTKVLKARGYEVVRTLTPNGGLAAGWTAFSVKRDGVEMVRRVRKGREGWEVSE